MNTNRRRFIKYLGFGLAGGAIAYYWPSEGILNPCTGKQLPSEWLEHEIVQSAWEGINPELYRDVHTHLIGTGDSQSGIYLNPDMEDVFTPSQFIRFKFYINASCSDTEPGIDRGYVYQLAQHASAFPTGAKFMLLAFDFNHDKHGNIDKEKSPFYTPNRYVQKIVVQNPDHFEWIASIHPYREDCVEALEEAVKGGAKAVKWLPSVMGINPSSERCDRFYSAMARYDLPLLTHAGDEHAVDGIEHQEFGNPLLLRRALDHGIRVIVAHCASEGSGSDLDKNHTHNSLTNFELFSRMMDEKKYEGKLFGEISAITQINRMDPALQIVLQRDDWHHRLLNGSDYPLPGVMPLFSTQSMYEKGFIPAKAVEPLREIRRYNPVLYDFVLKRQISWKGKQFSKAIFESKLFFEKNTGIRTG